MRQKLMLAFLLLATFGGGVAHATDPIVVTPDSTAAPTYTGADGGGVWAGKYFVVKQSYVYAMHVCTWSFIWADGTVARDTGYPGSPDSGSCYTYYANYSRAGQVLRITAPSCPFPGFHWFGLWVSYQYQYQTAPNGAWTAWTDHISSVVGPGVYGQVCV